METRTVRGANYSTVMNQLKRRYGSGSVAILSERSVADGIELTVRVPASPLSFDPRLSLSKRVIALIGPPGAGKTTTIAKLAARVARSSGLRIGLLSTDDYRIGAREHLAGFARLLSAPFLPLSSSKSLREQFPLILKTFGTCDLVLVDTAGIAHHESRRLGEAAVLLRGNDWIERWLVLPANTNQSASRHAAEAFSGLGIDRLVITKTDETDDFSPVIEIARNLVKPIAFFGTGQRVPEDIEPASAQRLHWMQQNGGVGTTQNIKGRGGLDAR